MTWLAEALRQARIDLIAQQRGEIVSPPEGVSARIYEGGWIDIDRKSWDFSFVDGPKLRRYRLRRDLADIAWILLQEAVKSRNVAPRTVINHYYGYIWAGRLLGSTVSDIRLASLEGVQKAWSCYKAVPQKLTVARSALVRLFVRLIEVGEAYPESDSQEALKIINWLYGSVTVPSPVSSEAYLSASELDAVIRGCIQDITSGINFTAETPELTNKNTIYKAYGNARSVLHWSVALIILLKIYTGLRRKSIIEVELDDWREIRPGLNVLKWRHPKTPEEKLAIIPAFVAEHLDFYVDRTMELREALGTNRVFIVNDQFGGWSEFRSATRLNHHLRKFAVRHKITRDGVPLVLSSNVFRRTFATQSLYVGRSLWAICLQMGHSQIRTTESYVKFDQYEHANQVRDALNEFGQKSLSLRHDPLILEDLDADERESVLAAREECDQGVGLCRYTECVKAAEGSAPPCCLCEHLVTSAEFLKAWEAEIASRKKEIERLSKRADYEHIVAQLRYQLGRFEANLKYLQGKFKK